MVSATSGPRLRDVNRVAILALVGRHGPISRADIARRLGLSPPTVTAVTRSFIEAGVLHKVDDDASRGGRPGELLAVAGSAASAIGVKVAAGQVTGVHADLDGTVLDTFSAPVDEFRANPFDALAELLAPRIATANPTLLGVGVGIPGFVDSGTGLVQAQLLGWKRMPLGDYLSQLTGVPVLVDNDVNTLAAYEHLYGLGRPYEDFLTITLGRGVGAAVFSGGDLRRGGHGAAGELGHLPVDPEGGLPCHCGRRGCLETYLSDDALARQAREQKILGTDETADDLRVKADAGDPAARDIYKKAGKRLGLAVAGLSVVLDPQAVLVSGEGSRAWTHLAEGFRPAFENGVFPGFAERIAVHVDPWDDAKWALGAAALVLRTPFTYATDPQADAVRARLAAFSAEAAA
jgi:predicted NBD/HSP70 family sugar kinase